MDAGNGGSGSAANTSSEIIRPRPSEIITDARFLEIVNIHFPNHSPFLMLHFNSEHPWPFP